MRKIKLDYRLHIIIGICCLFSCNKKDFLGVKPSSDITVPTTLADFQALLDYDDIMSETPVLGELSADNYYLTYSFWTGPSLRSTEHNSYTWEKDIYNGEGNIGDWNKPYEQVFYANVVLDGLGNIPKTATNEEQWNKIKGAALFIRAYAFYNLAQIFAPVYDSITSKTDLGIPLRLSANVDDITVRATVQKTYDRILVDLLESVPLLPEAIEQNRNRPSRPSALAMLARAFLSMGAYDKALLYADSSLKLYRTLIDYNSLNKGSALPFKPNNEETLYQSKVLSTTNIFKGIQVRNSIIDSTLFQSYSTYDLRDTIFYTKNSNGYPILKGSYNGTVFAFTGLATDEVYLIRAECLARLGNITDAVKDLNTLLIARWEKDTYIPYEISTRDEALALILTERRKELAFRGLRWTDVRRLNKEGANITLARSMNGRDYILSPNHPNYVLPIPPDVIALTGIPQNKRE